MDTCDGARFYHYSCSQSLFGTLVLPAVKVSSEWLVLVYKEIVREQAKLLASLLSECSTSGNEENGFEEAFDDLLDLLERDRKQVGRARVERFVRQNRLIRKKEVGV